MGTDVLGRDLLVRCMEGGRYALLVALLGTSVALLIGVSWGAISAYAGGRLDDVMMRIVDVLYALPTIMFVIVVQAVADVQSLFPCSSSRRDLCSPWPDRPRAGDEPQAPRVRRGARALELPGRLLFGHIVPNTAGPHRHATLSIPNVMLTEAVLSFLGSVCRRRARAGGRWSPRGWAARRLPWVLAGPGGSSR